MTMRVGQHLVSKEADIGLLVQIAFQAYVSPECSIMDQTMDCDSLTGAILAIDASKLTSEIRIPLFQVPIDLVLGRRCLPRDAKSFCFCSPAMNTPEKVF